MYAVFMDGKMLKDRGGKRAVFETLTKARKLEEEIVKTCGHPTEIRGFEAEFGGGEWVPVTSGAAKVRKEVLCGPAYQDSPPTGHSRGIWPWFRGNREGC